MYHFGVEYKGMAKLTTKEWREVLRLVELGVPKSQLAQKFGVCRASIYRKLGKEAKKSHPPSKEGAFAKRT